MDNYMYGDTKMEEYYDDDVDTSYVGFGSTIAPAEDESLYPIEEVRLELIRIVFPEVGYHLSSSDLVELLSKLEDYVYSE